MSPAAWRGWAWRTGTLVLLLGVLVPLLAGRFDLLFGTAAGSAAGPSLAAPCLPGQPVPIAESPHVSPAELAGYPARPASSGPHFAFTVAPGVYDAPLPVGLTVHALEHGLVVVQYAPGTPAGTVASLTRLAKRYGADVVLAPYPGLTTGVALTAWGRIDQLERYQEDRIIEFVERLRGRYQHGWTVEKEC